MKKVRRWIRCNIVMVVAVLLALTFSEMLWEESEEDRGLIDELPVCAGAGIAIGGNAVIDRIEKKKKEKKEKKEKEQKQEAEPRQWQKPEPQQEQGSGGLSEPESQQWQEPEPEPQQWSEPEPEEYGPTTPYGQPVPDPETVSAAGTAPAPEPVPATESVIAISGSLRGIAYPVGSTLLNFGRDPSCSVCLPLDTKGVSRMHCQMYRNENGRLMLMDCGSTYGTYVTGMGRLTANVAVEVGVGVPFYLGSDQVGFMVQRS